MLITVTNPPAPLPSFVVWNKDGNTVVTLNSNTETALGEYVGRVSVDRTTGSLEIRNLTSSNAGFYIVQMQSDILRRGETHLEVQGMYLLYSS